jgi:protein-disulfide isomerase
MKNNIFYFFLLLACATNLCVAENTVNAHKQAAKLAQHNTDFFTGPQSPSLFDSSDTLTASVLTTNTSKGLPETVYGNPETAKVKMTIYSAATCAYCAGYDSETIPQLMKLVKSGDLLLVLRPFIAHSPWDLLATQISWVKGREHQHALFGKFFAQSR